MTPAHQRLFASLDAAWPPASSRPAGAYRLRDGAGGGQRVSAATLDEAFREEALDELLAAEAVPVFQVRDGQDDLDAALDRRGWRLHDPVVILASPVADLAGRELPRVRAFVHWPPLAVQHEVWDGGGIGPERRAVMERAEGPKASVLGRGSDRVAGAAYCAVAGGIASVHALHVMPAFRRGGTAGHMMTAAARWAEAEGAETLVVAVAEANAPALALYARLGMTEAARYRYRLPPGTVA